MPQFYPDGPAAVSLNAIQESGGLNTPEQEDFDTPALQGTMQQLLSENLGKFVIADFLVGVSTLVRRVGVLYSVGRGFVVLYLEDYKAFEVCDIFSLKFVTFFPPGNEPTLEELLQGSVGSGILTGGATSGVLGGSSGQSVNSGMSTGMNSGMSTGMNSSMNSGMNSSMNSSMNSGMNSGMNGSMSGRGNYGNSNSPGCRTLGQR